MYLSIKEIRKKYNIRTEHLLTLCDRKQIPFVIKEGKRKKVDKYFISEDIIKQWVKNIKEYQDAINRGMIPISKFMRDNKIKMPCFFIYAWIRKKGAPVKECIHGLNKKEILGYPNDLKKWYEKNKKDIMDFRKRYQKEKIRNFRKKHKKITNSPNVPVWNPLKIISDEKFENNLTSILSFYEYVKRTSSKRRKKCDYTL